MGSFFFFKFRLLPRSKNHGGALEPPRFPGAWGLLTLVGKAAFTGRSDSVSWFCLYCPDLTLHGETHPVEATVNGGNGRYTGAAKFKQTEFGIKPVSVAGGSVKVKDELRIEFEITAK